MSRTMDLVLRMELLSSGVASERLSRKQRLSSDKTAPLKATVELSSLSGADDEVLSPACTR